MDKLDTTFSEIFKTEIIDYLKQNQERIAISCRLLNDDQIWWKPNKNSNSIGNLLIHLEGNLRQYILSGLGNKPDTRKRESEFTTKSISANVARDTLFNTIDECIIAIGSLEIEKLPKTYTLQGFKLSGINVLIHITEHLSYHTGQIALLTKLMVDKDLKFYGDKDLNTLNS